MVISSQKSKILVSKEPNRCKIEIDEPAETDYGNIFQITNRAAACLNNPIWRNKHIRMETKLRIYKAATKPVMTYTAGHRHNPMDTGDSRNENLRKNHQEYTERSNK